MKGSRHLRYFRTVFILLTALGIGQLKAAVTLGPIQVNSYIGQPLNASIALRGITDTQAANTRITLGDAAAYQARGVMRTASQSSLNFTMVKAGNGYRILVTTNVQVKEPFINFILSMNNAGSIINREYAVFLNPDPAARAGMMPRIGDDFAHADPKKLLTVNGNLPSPPNIAAASTVRALPRQEKSPDSESRQENQTRKTDNTFRPDQRQSQASSQQQTGVKRTSSDGTRYWKVERGDTLYSIAAATLPAWDFAIDSWMRSLYLANRQAFIDNSMDKLILGSRLKISAAVSVSVAHAKKDPHSKPESQKSKALAKKSRQNSRKADNSDSMKEKTAMQENITHKEANNPPVIDPKTPRAIKDSVLPVEKKADSGKKPTLQETTQRAEVGEKHEPLHTPIHEKITDSASSTGKEAATAGDTPAGAANDDLTAKTLLTKTTQDAQTDHAQPSANDARLRKETLLALDPPQNIAELPESVAVPPKNDAKAQKRAPEISDTEVRKTINNTIAEQQVGSDVNTQTRGEETASGVLSAVQSTAKEAAKWVTGKTSSITAALPTQITAATQQAYEQGPLGLAWWQIIAAGCGIVLLLLVALRRSRRKAANADMSKEELDRMVADMENDDLFADSIQLSEQERTTLDQVMVENPGDNTIAPDDTGTESAEEPDFENQLLKDSDETGIQNDSSAVNEKINDDSISAGEILASDDTDETGSQNDPSAANKAISDDSISAGEIFDHDDTEHSLQVSEEALTDEGWDLQVVEEEAIEDDSSIELDGFSHENDSDTQNVPDSIELDNDSDALDLPDFTEFDNDSDALDLPDFTDLDNDSDALDLPDFTEFDDATLFESAESHEPPAPQHMPEEEAVANDNALELLDAGADDDNSTFFADVSTATDDSFHETSTETEESVVPTGDSLDSGKDDSELIDFSDETIVTPSESVVSEEISDADEQAMEINLDLAETYIESGVKPEKAKRWLQEVLECGSQEQRERARILLEKL